MAPIEQQQAAALMMMLESVLEGFGGWVDDWNVALCRYDIRYEILITRRLAHSLRE